MTDHDFVPGPVVSTPGLVGRDKDKVPSFICSLCKRTTTTPALPRESCPGPSGIGDDRLAFLSLVELRRLNAAIEELLDSRGIK